MAFVYFVVYSWLFIWLWLKGDVFWILRGDDATDGVIVRNNGTFHVADSRSHPHSNLRGRCTWPPFTDENWEVEIGCCLFKATELIIGWPGTHLSSCLQCAWSSFFFFLIYFFNWREGCCTLSCWSCPTRPQVSHSHMNILSLEPPRLSLKALNY